MNNCENCMFYSQEHSDFIAQFQDSAAVNEKPKEHFCMIFSDGIPGDVWAGKQECDRRYPNEGK